MSEQKAIPMWKLKVKAKIQMAKNKVKGGIDSVVEYGKEHPDHVLLAIGGVASMAKFGLKEKRKHDDMRRKQCMFYDRRSDEWHESKRPLKPLESRELERFYKDGGLKSDYLAKKGLLKY